MSMISALIDELNKSADEWNSSNMFELARMCREAADTITELRGALQVASVDYRYLSEENAELRELCKEMRVCLEDECKLCHEWGDACDLEHQMCELGVEVD